MICWKSSIFPDDDYAVDFLLHYYGSWGTRHIGNGYAVDFHLHCYILMLITTVLRLIIYYFFFILFYFEVYTSHCLSVCQMLECLKFSTHSIFFLLVFLRFPFFIYICNAARFFSEADGSIQGMWRLGKYGWPSHDFQDSQRDKSVFNFMPFWFRSQCCHLFLS